MFAALKPNERLPSICSLYQDQTHGDRTFDYNSAQASSDAPLQGDTEELLRLDGKFHRELVHHLAGVPVDNQSHGLFGRDAALLAIEKLLFANFARRRLVFHHGRFVLYVSVRERVRAAGRTEQEAVALAVVARALGPGRNLHQSAVAILAMPGGDAFRYNRTACIPSQMNHLRARIRLLVIVRHGDGVEPDISR